MNKFNIIILKVIKIECNERLLNVTFFQVYLVYFIAAINLLNLFLQLTIENKKPFISRH